MTIDATPARRIHGRSRALRATVPALLACVVAWGCATGGGEDADAEPPSSVADSTAGPSTGEEEGDREGAASRQEPAAPQDALPPRVPGEAAPARPDSGTAWVVFGADTVVAEVAATGDARSRGLQGRESVPPGTGMLFVYGERDVRSFWMVNTPAALDIAFLDTMDGEELGTEGVPEGRYRVVDVQSMEPETSTLHTSAEPAVMALEVPRGWFEEHGVAAGDTAVVVWGG